MDKQVESKPKRRPLHSYFTKEQLEVLQRYFNDVNQMPKHAEKKALADQYGMDGCIVNKWFQSQRIKTRKKAAKNGVIIPKKRGSNNATATASLNSFSNASFQH